MRNIKSKTGILIFGLIFAAVGVGFLAFQTVPSLLEAHEMKSWMPVDAEVLNTNLESHRGDDSTTYKVTGRYRYSWQGQTYTAERISIHSGSDNIGSYHQDRYRELRNAKNSGTPIRIYVNPDAPAEAIYDPKPRWGLLLFGLIFVFAFGGVGFGVIFYAIFFKGGLALKAGTADNQPWLHHKDWQGGEIYSSAKSGMLVLIFASIIWNGFCWPMAFIVLGDSGLRFPEILVALFPLIGIFILYSAISKVSAWLKYGRTPLVLDPFPGSIGGNVGGHIEINQPWQANRHYKVTISCLYSYVSGSGKNRSRKEKLVWQENGYAESNSFNNKTRLKFRFEIPKDLPASEAVPGETYHLWRLSIRCDDKGAKIDRSFTIPVYATAQMSQIAYPLSKDHPALKEHTLDAIESFLRIERKGSALSIHMPLGQRIKTACVTFLVCALITGSTVYFYQKSDSIVLLIVAFVAGLIASFALFAMGKSRRALLSNSGIEVKTCFLGFPVKGAKLSRSEYRSMELNDYMRSSSGHKHIEYYQIRALGPAKKKIVIAERLRGKHEAEQLLESIKTLTGYQ